MALVSREILTGIDYGLQVAGLACALGFVIRLVRSGEVRNPLAALRPSGDGPHAAHLFAIAFAYLLLVMTAGRLIGLSPEQAAKPGTHDWHMAQASESIIRLALVAVIFVLLRRHSSFADRRPALRATSIVATAVVTALACLPVCYSQLALCKVVWHWLDPGAVQPVHGVLEAIEHSAWGGWGTVQLVLTAVVIAPLGEELFFRGLLLETLWRHLGLAWVAVALSALAFGYVHQSQPQDVLPLATFGLILGYLRLRYRSLALCVLVHALFNLRTMAFVLLNPDMARAAW